MIYHYTYRITNTLSNIHYYGTRTSHIIPKDDIGIYYFSSSSNKDFVLDQNNNPQNYKYKVIRIFNTREEAISLEIKLHNKFDVAINENFYNKAKQTSIGFDNTGVKYSEEINKSKGRSGPKSWLKIPRKQELIDKAKNMLNVLTPEGEKLYISNTHEKYLDGTYISINSITGANKDYRKKLSENHADFSGSNHPGAKIIHIFDNEDNLQFTCNGNFASVCKANNLPMKALNQSFKDNSKLYQSKMGLSKAKKNGNDIYHGWYAKLLK